MKYWIHIFKRWKSYYLVFFYHNFTIKWTYRVNFKTFHYFGLSRCWKWHGFGGKTTALTTILKYMLNICCKYCSLRKYIIQLYIQIEFELYYIFKLNIFCLKLHMQNNITKCTSRKIQFPILKYVLGKSKMYFFFKYIFG